MSRQMSRENALCKTIRDGLDPIELTVTNESSMHNVPADSETHFRLLVVADSFSGQSRVARHRTIHRLIGEQFREGLHALAIDALTPDEWQERNQRASVSPDCRGGDGSLPAR